MEKHFDPIAVAQKVVLFNDQGKVLVLKQSGYRQGNVHWDLPGGRVHEGEDFEAAIRREVEEETDIRPRCLRLFCVEPEKFPSGDPAVVVVYSAFSRIDPKLSSEHSSYEWVDPKNIGVRNWLFERMPGWITKAPRPHTSGAMCIVENGGDTLLLKRSEKVSGWRGWYYGVAGGVEDGEEPLDTAFKELSEETGLSEKDVELLRAGEPFKLTEYETVYSFLFRAKHRNITINWEHDEAVWVAPKDIVNYNCVPFFTRSAKSLGLDVEINARVVSCVVLNGGKMLLLKRGPNVATHRGKWGVVAGYIEPGEKPQETAFKEIIEEIGLQTSQLRLLKAGEPRTRTSEGIIWSMHPFLFESSTDKVNIDWEHEEYRWIHPHEIKNFDISPGVENVLEALGIPKAS